jgi:hypothetical protein
VGVRPDGTSQFNSDINILTPQQVLSCLVQNYDILREAFYSLHFHIAIISLIFQLNVHGQLNICIVYWMSPTCFGAHCAILRYSSYHFSKPSAYCKVVTMVELQSRAITTRQYWFNTYEQPYNKQMVLRSDKRSSQGWWGERQNMEEIFSRQYKYSIVHVYLIAKLNT